MSLLHSLIGFVRVAFIGCCVAGILSGCKDDKKDKSEAITVMDENICNFSAAGQGCTIKSVGDTVTIDLSSSTNGQQYVIAPYILGDTKTIAGSLKARKFNFNFKTNTGASLSILNSDSGTGIPSVWSTPAESKQMREHDKRTLANHFDPRKGLNQEPWFWQLARNLDRAIETTNYLATEQSGGVEQFYRSLTLNSLQFAPSELTLDGGNCPTSQILVPQSDGVGTTTPSLVDHYADPEGKFCIAYISNPTTVSDKEAIKAAISKIMRVYSGVVYDDKFATKGGYKFRPVFAFVDVKDEDVWDQAEPLNLAGVFVSYTSLAAGYPIIYIASDFTKVASFGESSQTEVLKGQFFSVMAHELQHAILHYYRLNAAGTTVVNGEPVSIDEGLAHFMEDLFGYGADGFRFWALPFLQGYSDGVTPFLVGGDDYGSGVSAPLARSSAHTLLYYLASQKGGVTFDKNGEPSGGGGLSFIKELVKNASAAGPANLASVFGGDWSVVIGNYLGALAVDNVDVGATIAKKFTVQQPSNSVTNLTGKPGQVYGMRFNNYLDLTARPASDYGNPKGSPAISGKMSYYMTAPLLLTVSNPAEKIVFQCDCGGDSSNVAASVVRVK